jgi:ubiquinone/menaquinone biosynthesis C-methylase UbiE
MGLHDVLHPVLRRVFRGHTVITGGHAAYYDRVVSRLLLGRLYAAAAQRVTEAAPNAASILDVGTGPGRLLVEIAHRRPDLRLTGVDPSADMVARAQAVARDAGVSGRIDVRAAAAEALPFGDGEFDVVVSTLSAHHWNDLAAGIREQARVLRPGGDLWVLDRRASADSVRAALREAFPQREIERLSLGGGMTLRLTGHRVTKSG